MKIMRLVDRLLVKDDGLPKSIVKVAASKAMQAAKEKRERRKARNLVVAQKRGKS